MTAPSVGDRVTPTGVFLGQWAAGSTEWHDARRARLGGSEIAAVLGLSKWESRFSLYHRKIGAIADQPENDEMEWGKRLEPVLLAKHLDRHPDYTVGPAGTFVHADRDWQLANPDALVVHEDGGPPLLWEAKTSRDDLGWGPDGSDQLPIYYRCQVQWYLDVLGLHAATVSVLIAGQDYREIHLTADPTDQQLQRTAAREFLDTIVRDERPDIDAHSATYQAVRDLHPDIDPVDVELPADLGAAYTVALQNAWDADQAKQQAVSRVLDAMGRARRATSLGLHLATRIPGRGDNPPFLRPANGLITKKAS